MENIIKIENKMFSEKHFVLTDNGWIRAKKLKSGDNIITATGKVEKIKKIIKCGKRPNAPIID